MVWIIIIIISKYINLNFHTKITLLSTTTATDETTTRDDTFIVINQNLINVLIAMPINCKYNITKNIDRLKYDKNYINIFWYFNIYDYDQCNNDFNDLLLSQNRNINITKHKIRKLIFWIDYLSPNYIADKFDFLWLIDSDLMLENFNFNAFIKLSLCSKFNLSLIQPSIMAKCKKCRGSDWENLNHDYYYHQKKKGLIGNGLIGYSVQNIEIMAPLIRIEIWNVLYSYIYDTYKVIGKDLILTNWGVDYWWCGAIKLLINSNNNVTPPCIVMEYTPIIHIDTHSLPKSDEYMEQGFELRDRLRNHSIFSKFIKIQDTMKMEMFYINDLYQLEPPYFES